MKIRVVEQSRRERLQSKNENKDCRVRMNRRVIYRVKMKKRVAD